MFCAVLQDYACRVFSHVASRKEELSSHQSALRAQRIIDAGGVACVLDAMNMHSMDPFVQSNATVALASLLATNESLAITLGGAGVLSRCDFARGACDAGVQVCS